MMSLLTESRARKQVTETRKRTPPAVFRPELKDTEDREEVTSRTRWTRFRVRFWSASLTRGAPSSPGCGVGASRTPARTGRTGRCSSAGHNSHTSPPAEDQRRPIGTAPLTDTAMATGPARLQIRVSYRDSQQKSGFP